MRLEFKLPEDAGGSGIHLPVCSALSVHGPPDGDSDGVRAYTPIASEADTFSLLVKNYTTGRTSNWLHGRDTRGRCRHSAGAPHPVLAGAPHRFAERAPAAR